MDPSRHFDGHSDRGMRRALEKCPVPRRDNGIPSACDKNQTIAIKNERRIFSPFF